MSATSYFVTQQGLTLLPPVLVLELPEVQDVAPGSWAMVGLLANWDLGCFCCVSKCVLWCFIVCYVSAL